MELLMGETTDIDSWMNLVKQVSWNFPGLETTENIDEHRDTVLKFMDKKQALCVKNKEEKIGRAHV